MSQQIYNEGRVVGYSAYELYVKKQQSIDPDTPPASEREWLASSLAMGASMLLKVTADNIDDLHYRDIPLPTDSRLCAANTIIASFFNGDAVFDNNSVWAKKIKDYGSLIINTSKINSPNNGGTDNVPTKSPLSDVDITKLMQYIKIADGIVIQPGTWEHRSYNSDNTPYKDFTPDLTKSPTIRLLFTNKISNDFYVLLTGFSNRIVIEGETITYSSTDTNYTNPENGGFLGPDCYPWANKIIFSQPAILSHYLSEFIGSGSQNVVIEHDTNPDNPPTKITVKNDIDRGSKTYITSAPKKSSNSNRLPSGYTGQNVYVGQSAEVGPDVTKIGVKNVITSKKSYLISEQSEDGGKTELDFKVSGGLGISLIENDGELTITNSMPNYGSSISWTHLPENSYDVQFFNGFTNPLTNTTGTNHFLVDISPALDTDGNIVSCAMCIYGNDNWKDSSKATKPYALDVDKNIMLAHATPFYATDEERAYKSWLVAITFKDVIINITTGPYKGKSFNLLQLNNLNYQDTTESGNGLWNCGYYETANQVPYEKSYQPYGSSFIAFCSSYRVKDSENAFNENEFNIEDIGNSYRFKFNWNGTVFNRTLNKNAILIKINSYGDGYNTQFSVWSPPDGVAVNPKLPSKYKYFGIDNANFHQYGIFYDASKVG